ncbi:hypothetical protein DFJ58DRAFT_825552 [Suillus subalutaceus]|uniref:uncharacterized protein n=1 Tax=Suillus subalutaceus TaxID=48586 RepID=UPI001B870DEF|nr:uncharacterized protein DFJ58DRAFT_825552 [Suillus subalutaceus]KAG1829527.1 hypothetical protein DFJ58DRAFT_825552 [Suillus subalutaceus]
MRGKRVETKRATLALLDVTRYALETITSTIETDTTIWQSCRNKELSKKIQMFLYKTLNNAFKIGDFWTQIPTFEHRARRQSCREDTESMEHILMQCNHPTRKRIWGLAKSLWPTKHGPWPEPTIGLILGCGALSLPQLPRDRNPDDGQNTDNSVVKRWTNAINRRLQLDRAIACKSKRTPKATTHVHNTWADVIDIDKNTQTRTNDWVTTLEVLVGIKLPRPPQTEVTR